MAYIIKAAMFQLPLAQPLKSLGERLTQTPFFSLGKVVEKVGSGIEVFAHNFWLLEQTPEENSADALFSVSASSSQHRQNSLLSALQGLATSRTTEEIVPIGYTKDHSLRAYHLIYDPEFAAKYGEEIATFQLPTTHSHVIYTGEDALERWNAAVACVEKINVRDLDYPPGGVGFFKKKINSNSVYRTFAEVMRIEPYEFHGFRAIGIKNSIEIADRHPAFHV